MREALLGSVTCVWPLVRFQTGEVGVEQQAGFGAHHGLVAGGLEPGAVIGGAPVLPDDGIVQRLAAGAVPDDDGLALVGDADSAKVARVQAGFGEGRARAGKLAVPDFQRVVLDPSGLRKNLPELALCQRSWRTVLAKDNGARTGGALVER